MEAHSYLSRRIISLLQLLRQPNLRIAKGPSQTTVTASPKYQPSGDKVLVRNSHRHISRHKTNRTSSKIPQRRSSSLRRKPSSMDGIRLHETIKPTNFTGVPVAISVIDANGNYRTIGTTTTDSSGTYGFTWMPDIKANTQSSQPSQVTRATMDQTPKPTLQ